MSDIKHMSEEKPPPTENASNNSDKDAEAFVGASLVILILVLFAWNIWVAWCALFGGQVWIVFDWWKFDGIDIWRGLLIIVCQIIVFMLAVMLPSYLGDLYEEKATYKAPQTTGSLVALSIAGLYLLTAWLLANHIQEQKKQESWNAISSITASSPSSKITSSQTPAAKSATGPSIGSTYQGYEIVSKNDCSYYSYKKDGYKYSTLTSGLDKYCGSKYVGASDDANYDLRAGETYKGYKLENSGPCSPSNLRNSYKTYYEVTIDGKTWCATK